MSVTTMPTVRIYKVECLKNGKIYVGRTSKTALGRWASHVATLRTGKHFNKGLQDDFDKYGEPGFLATTLEKVPAEHAADYEAIWMVKLGSIFPKKGYNRIGVTQIEAMAKDPERRVLFDRLQEEDVKGHLLSWLGKSTRANRGKKAVFTSSDASRDMAHY